MDGRLLGEQLGKVVAGREVSGGEVSTDALAQHLRAAERLLHGDLLVQGHAEQKRERVPAEQRVCLVVTRDVKVRHTRSLPLFRSTSGSCYKRPGTRPYRDVHHTTRPSMEDA